MVWSLQHPVPFVGSCQAGGTGTYFSVHLYIHFWINSARVGIHFWINSVHLHAHFSINLVCLHAHFSINSVRLHIHFRINMLCWQRLGPGVGQFSWAELLSSWTCSGRLRVAKKGEALQSRGWHGPHLDLFGK